MTALVLALGWRPTLGARARLAAAVACGTCGFLALGALLIDVCGIPATLVQACSWVSWLFWLGIVFPRSSLRDGVALAQMPYRTAFMREILPGIACSFAQLLRPAVEGSLHGAPLENPVLILVGALLLAGGWMLIVVGVRALGVARVLFVHEYLPPAEESAGITSEGIYSRIRHPLFVGGILGSVGLGLCVGTPEALRLAALNLCSLPAYVCLEDRRCSRVIGDPYVRYRQRVGAVIPRIRRAVGD
jgi:protein-S-isoprenylcysteine O-methyltransferase Ste14